MATKDIDLMGATYQDVPAVDLPQNGGGTARFVEISDTTATANDVSDGDVFYTSGGTRTVGSAKYAGAPVNNGNATATNAILYGKVDATSTATVFTATVAGLTSYYHGAAVMLRNGVITSAANCTLNVNGLGAKPIYNSMADATRDSTIFNINYTLLFVYDENRVDGGCWVEYRGYNSDTNTIGYQLRTNSTTMPVSDTARYYKIYFTQADGTKWVPASVDSTNNATSSRAVNQRPIDPFGRIAYTSATTKYSAGSNLAAATTWSQYNLTLGYSFNRTGAALTLTTSEPVYIKCAPQSDGSAIIDANTPYVQALPSTADGKIYIFLGIATGATTVEMYINHPVYEYKDGAIRIYTNADIPTKTSELTNDSGFITGYTETDPVFTASAAHGITSSDITNWNGKQAALVSGTNIKTVNSTSLLGSGNIAVADVSHSHGNITSGGDITTNSTIANGDRLIINDESASKLANSSITFGSSTTQFLANNGTWQTPSGGGGNTSWTDVTASVIESVWEDYAMAIDNGSTLIVSANYDYSELSALEFKTSWWTTRQVCGYGDIAIGFAFMEIDGSVWPIFSDGIGIYPVDTTISGMIWYQIAIPYTTV